MTHSCHYRLRALFAAAFLLFTVPALAAFNDNGDGTVTDTVTGLMWDKCSWGQSGDIDCATGAASTHTWAAALGVAVTANAATYKGHDDWRLPNRTELESLVDITALNPAIDTTAFPNTQSNWYWTSTTQAPDPALAWDVNFFSGSTNALNKTFTLHVRLVRSGQSFDALAAAAGNGGGANSIPTLSEWAMILLSLLMAGIAVVTLRRRVM